MRKVCSWKQFGFVLGASTSTSILLKSAGISVGFNSRGIDVATLSKFPINETLRIKLPLAVRLITGILINLDFEEINVTRFSVRVSYKLKSNIG